MRQDNASHDTNGINPYSAPPPVTESTAAAATSSSIVFGKLMTCIVAVAFLSLGYFAIRKFLNGQWLIAYLALSGSLMCVPFVDVSATMREKLAVSCIMPFAVGGLACFVLLYFQMFKFAWFESVFNDKGAGPLGLLVSAVVGLAAGGFVGGWVIKFLGWAPPPRKVSE